MEYFAAEISCTAGSNGRKGYGRWPGFSQVTWLTRDLGAAVTAEVAEYGFAAQSVT